MGLGFWMCFLLMIGFIARWTLSGGSSGIETVCEGNSVNISFNTTGRCVRLGRRADPNHTWRLRCMVCLENGPLCPELRSRVDVFPHGLTLHNVSKADEGIYSITPPLNGNGKATNIVHLVVDCRPSSTQEPPNSTESGTTRRTGHTDSQLVGVVVGVVGVMVVIVWVIVIVLKKKSAQSQCCRRRQSSEHQESNPVALQTSHQANEHPVGVAMQEQDLLVKDGGPGGQRASEGVRDPCLLCEEGLTLV